MVSLLPPVPGSGPLAFCSFRTFSFPEGISVSSGMARCSADTHMLNPDLCSPLFYDLCLTPIPSVLLFTIFLKPESLLEIKSLVSLHLS